MGDKTRVKPRHVWLCFYNRNWLLYSISERPRKDFKDGLSWWEADDWQNIPTEMAQHIFGVIPDAEEALLLDLRGSSSYCPKCHKYNPKVFERWETINGGPLCCRACKTEVKMLRVGVREQLSLKQAQSERDISGT